MTIFNNCFLCCEYRTPLEVELKNGSTQFLARRVYITSNAGWRTWWASDLLANKNNEGAIERRITVEKHFHDVYVAPSSGELRRSDSLSLILGEPTQLDRQNAIVGPNTLSELFCDEEQEFLQACFEGRNQ